MKVLWTPQAFEKIEQISDYIARDKPSAARKWLDAALQKTDLLKENPALGRMVPELKSPAIREIIFGNYRIIYRIAGNEVRILTVRSFRQILKSGEDGTD